MKICDDEMLMCLFDVSSPFAVNRKYEIVRVCAYEINLDQKVSGISVDLFLSL